MLSALRHTAVCVIGLGQRVENGAVRFQATALRASVSAASGRSKGWGGGIEPGQIIQSLGIIGRSTRSFCRICSALRTSPVQEEAAVYRIEICILGFRLQVILVMRS